MEDRERDIVALKSIERHRTGRIGWLRAAVLGANDGILSTSSLVLGVAASHASRGSVVVAGVAGLVAGAMSMASGEYVSVHSQADTEEAELELERTELKTNLKGEHVDGNLRGSWPPACACETSRRTTHEPRCLGCARARRTGNFRYLSSASYSSRLSIGRQLCHRGRNAACNHRFGIRFFADPLGFG